MSETRKTLYFAGAAILLVLIAFITTPKQVTPDAFSDLGEMFFPEFTDPNAARTLEVIEFDEETGSAKPFKVTFKGGRWTIPSHYDYPADGKDRLAQTAAGLIGITKDDFRTDNVSDFAACGVVDPMDESVVELGGRGKRVTIKGENDVVLADLVIGKSYEDRENFHLVRVPGQKRVYGSLIDVDISTTFSDWIESDLVMVTKDQITDVTIKDYSIDEATRKIEARDEFTLRREGEDWTATDLKEDQEVDRYKMNNFLRAVEELSIVGVRPKPEGLSASLQQTSSEVQITTGDMLSLQGKGFFFDREGRLRSNEGELQLTTNKGVVYALRFGEVAYGTGLDVTAGSGEEEGGDAGPAENRYMMITTVFNPAVFPEPEKPASTDFLEKPDSLWTPEDHRMKSIQMAHEDWAANVAEGRKLSDELNNRFAGWYYVISAESFEKLHVSRDGLVKEKPKTN